MQDYKGLVDYIASLGSAGVALSGGADSSLLCFAAHEALGDNAVAFTLDTCFMPRREMERAKQAAAWAGIKHVPVHSNPLENPEIKSNTEMRCYYCKKALFSQVAIKAREAGLRYVIDGTNSDDDPTQRPGMKALAELGVVSPLREAGIGKARVREIARVLGLPSWDTPTYSCLATKVQKNKPITIEQLKLAESAEEALISLGMEGFKVRLIEDGIRVETTGETLLNNREEAGRVLKKLGFADIDLI